eukprot:3455874-Amphidinium_carterae.1
MKWPLFECYLSPGGFGGGCSFCSSWEFGEALQLFADMRNGLLECDDTTMSEKRVCVCTDQLSYSDFLRPSLDWPRALRFTWRHARLSGSSLAG